MCGSWAYMINPKGKIIRGKDKNRVPLSYDLIKEQISESTPIIFSNTLMLLREVYENIGGYRLYFNRLTAEDYDWILMIIDKYFTINIPYYLYSYRQHSSSIMKEISEESISCGRAIARQSALFLASQRKKYGKDALMDDDLFPEFEEYTSFLRTPYLKDRSLILREKIQLYVYTGMHLESIKLAFYAIKVNPAKPINYLMVLYSILKLIIPISLHEAKQYIRFFKKKIIALFDN